MARATRESIDQNNAATPNYFYKLVADMTDEEYEEMVDDLNRQDAEREEIMRAEYEDCSWEPYYD